MEAEVFNNDRIMERELNFGFLLAGQADKLLSLEDVPASYVHAAFHVELSTEFRQNVCASMFQRFISACEEEFLNLSEGKTFTPHSYPALYLVGRLEGIYWSIFSRKFILSAGYADFLSLPSTQQQLLNGNDGWYDQQTDKLGQQFMDLLSSDIGAEDVLSSFGVISASDVALTMKRVATISYFASARASAVPDDMEAEDSVEAAWMLISGLYHTIAGATLKSESRTAVHNV